MTLYHSLVWTDTNFDIGNGNTDIIVVLSHERDNSCSSSLFLLADRKPTSSCFHKKYIIKNIHFPLSV